MFLISVWMLRLTRSSHKCSCMSARKMCTESGFKGTRTETTSEKDDTKEEMLKRARKYVEVTGVSLKFEIEQEQDPAVNNLAQLLAQRLFAEHPEVDPLCLRPSRLLLLAKESCVEGLNEEEIGKVVDEWNRIRDEEIERVTFDNVASYEP